MKLVVLYFCLSAVVLCVFGLVSCNEPKDTPDSADGEGVGDGTPPAGGADPAAAAAAAEAAKQANAAAAQAAATKQAAAKQAEASKQAADAEWAATALSDPTKGNLTAPDLFKAKFETSKGDFVIEVHRDWSPNGADRFYNLVKMGFYSEVRFFRVLQGFMAQMGMNGDPAVHSKWSDASIMDDPVKKSNERGYVTFAKTPAPNSRSTQFFINYGNNARLDRDGFSPFGIVMDGGMSVVDSLYSGYRERPNQNMIKSQGNAYLEEKFPNLDYVKTVTIVE